MDNRRSRLTAERKEGTNDMYVRASEPTIVRLQRDMKPALEFTGWTLATVTTRAPGKPRWTELTVWAVDDSDVAMWVVEVVGRSMVEGEVDYRDATPCDSVDDLRAALSKQGELTAPGRAVLLAAAQEDEELMEQLNDDERVERL